MSNNINLLQSFLNYCADKGKVINQNIANTNTPNYKRHDVDFKAYLSNELSESKSSSTVNQNDPVIVEDKNVTIEEEMAELAKNTINFKFASKRVSSYYKNLQSVIKSRG